MPQQNNTSQRSTRELKINQTGKKFQPSKLALLGRQRQIPERTLFFKNLGIKAQNFLKQRK